jgi:hypothetical protein
MRVRWAVPFLPLACAIACGTLKAADDDPGSTPDAGGGDSDGGDATDGGTCDPAKPFAPPTPLAGVNTPQEELGAWPFGSKIFVGRGSADAEAIVAIDTAGGPPVAIQLSSQFVTNPTLSTEGLTMFFEEVIGAAPAVNAIGRAKRSTTSLLDFVEQPTVDFADAGGVEQITPRLWGDQLWFSGYTDAWRLFHATVDGETVGVPLEAAELHESSSGEFMAVLTGDRRRIYFGRGVDHYTIWTASRTGPSDAFSDVHTVAELNGLSTQLPVWISDDGCTIWINGSGAGTGGSDLFVAKKPP